MSCDHMQQELVGFHFGEIELKSRSEVEHHLLTCSKCLGEFLALKRDIETAEQAPPAHVKATLRSAIAAELGVPPRRRLWWERPLAYGLAAAALIVAMVTVEWLATSAASQPAGWARQLESSE